MMRYIILSIFLLNILSFSVQAKSYHHSNNIVDIDIVSESGKAFNTYPADTKDHYKNVYRNYVEAKKDYNYGIYIRNHTNQTIGLLIAVDGRNIISGKRSDLKPTEKMYILKPHASATYKGWRTSNKYVHNFVFTEANDSYAGKWNDYSAMGTIAVAVFYPEEKEEYYSNAPKYPHSEKEYSTNSFKEGDKKRALESVTPEAGTGFGDKDYAPVKRVKFNPESSPRATYFFKYEWRESLCQKGIINCYNYKHHDDHNRFWDEYENYVPYPPNYKNRY